MCEKWKFTLSKAIGRDNFSIGAETEEPDEVVWDGIEAVEADEMDEKDDAGRSEYNTSWLLLAGSETATAVIADKDDDGSVVTNEISRALSGGSLLLGVGSMALWAPVMYLFWHQFSEPFKRSRFSREDKFLGVPFCRKSFSPSSLVFSCRFSLFILAETAFLMKVDAFLFIFRLFFP